MSAMVVVGHVSGGGGANVLYLPYAIGTTVIYELFIVER